MEDTSRVLIIREDTLLKGEIRNGGGFEVFGYVDGSNYSYLMLNTVADETRLFTVINGVRHSIATASRPGPGAHPQSS